MMRRPMREIHLVHCHCVSCASLRAIEEATQQTFSNELACFSVGRCIVVGSIFSSFQHLGREHPSAQLNCQMCYSGNHIPAFNTFIFLGIRLNCFVFDCFFFIIVVVVGTAVGFPPAGLKIEKRRGFCCYCFSIWDFVGASAAFTSTDHCQLSAVTKVCLFLWKEERKKNG